MCGIVGFINKSSKKVESHSILKMMAAIKHRGPDDDGIYLDGNIGLGFVRLSILDTSLDGHQPMISTDGNLVLLFNGEIFNFIELKKNLESSYKFKSNSDTEVILAAYLKWGRDCVEHFIGMWAFAIYDKIRREIFISRDRFGIKPIYYYEDKEKILFASDFPAINTVLKSPPSPDNRVIFDFLVHNRTDYSECTFFTGIKRIPAGHNMIIRQEIPSFQEWYNLQSRTNDAVSFNDPVDEFRELFFESVKLHCRSDVPVGVCLSGGLDSSSILSVILKERLLSLVNCFSAVYGKGQTGDESHYINLFESNEVIKNFIIPTDDTLFNDLYKFHDAISEPIPGISYYSEFKIMEATKGKCTVLLSGQGADEMLAGYHYFFCIYFKQLLKHKKIKLLFNELHHYLRHHGVGAGISSFIYMNLPKYLRRRLILHKRAILNSSFIVNYDDEISISDSLFNLNDLKASFFAHFKNKFEHHLKFSDKSGMYFSIEARFPFLHHILVEKTLKLSNDFVIKNGMNKFILRESMKNILIEKIRLRMDKVGFEAPERKWLNSHRFRNLFNDIIHYGKVQSLGIYNQEKIKQIINKHAMNMSEVNELWKMLSLELFMNKWYQ